MSQQGDRHSGQGDDWWTQLYDDAPHDTGPTPAPDSLDDRFASATDALMSPTGPPATAPPTEARPAPAPTPAPAADTAPADVRSVGSRAGAPPEAHPADAAPGGAPSAAAAPADARPRPGAAPPPPAGPWAAAPPADAPPTGPRPGAASTPVPPADAAPAPKTPAPDTDDPPGQEAPDRSPVAPYTPERAPWEPRPGPGVPATFGPGRVDAVPRPRRVEQVAVAPRPVHVGAGPPTYAAEPTALPLADPDELDELVADTVLDGARYGVCTLRAASVRGDSARFRGEPRRDSLLTARFGTGSTALLVVAMATGARAAPGAHLAAAEVCHWIGRAVGRSHARLAEDLRAGRRGDLKSGLHRLTDRSLGKLREAAAEQGVAPEEYSVTSLRCLLVPADPECRTRVFFGVGGGGLFRLRDGRWQDIEPAVTESASGGPVVGFGSPPAETTPVGTTPVGTTPVGTTPAETPEGDRLTMDLGVTTPGSPYEPAVEPPREPFRFRASVARPGDTLLVCSGGLAEPLRGEPEFAGHLRQRWESDEPPGLAAFLADTQLRAKGYADDRTACALWEA